MADKGATPVSPARAAVRAQVVIRCLADGQIGVHCTDPDPVRPLGYLEMAKAQVMEALFEQRPEVPDRPRVEPVRVI